MLDSRDLILLRNGLVFVWLATAFASVWELQGQSLQLLTSAGIDDRTLAFLLILGGAAVDAALGLAMWIKPGRRVYLSALGMMGAMTLAATALAPGLWLHPLGPLTKNVPIAVALWILARARS
jgi:DoxX-like family